MRQFKRIFISLVIWLAFSSATTTLCYSQQRQDEELPKLIGTPKTLSTFTGWTKNNIGKWNSLPNGIPQYDYSLKQTMPYCERLVKIDVQKIEVEGKNYWCVAKFTKHIYGYRSEKLEYVTDYWIFELPTSLLQSTDTSVSTVSFNTFFNSEIPLINYRPITWTDIIKDLKKNLVDKSELEGMMNDEKKFFIQYRNDTKNNKVQFMIGTYKKDDLSETFDYKLLCVGEDKNVELSNMYYEIAALNFKNLFSQLLK